MPLNVLLVASEALPLAKTGGLADMLSAYAPAIRGAGVEATLLMPGYPEALRRAHGLTHVATLDDLPGGSGELWQGRLPDTGVPVLLLRMDQHYARSGLYQDEDGNEWADNAIRFGALAAAAARIAAGLPGLARPNIVHAHDWHAGLTPLYLKLAGLHATKSVFTIHNLAFQGNYSLSSAAALGLPTSLLTAGPDADGIEFYGQLSFMKAGIRFADRVTTVSENYAREIMTPRFGQLMDGVLHQHASKVVGITNGIDMAAWNPADDPLIARAFSINDMRGKHSCKRDLQQLFGLPVDPFVPVLAIGSRLTAQKMVDLARDTLENVLQAYPRLQVVVMGKGEAAAEAAMVNLARRFPDRVAVHIGYDEKRAHMLHAGADILLHGSRFEPCGLTPMYTMRYGTIPVASRVGGLADTIVDEALVRTTAPLLREASTGAIVAHAVDADLPATGFLFDGESVAQMTAAVVRAIESFMRPASWRALQRNAMQCDFSWQRPAKQYVELYAALSGRTVVKAPRTVPKTRAVRAVPAAANDRAGRLVAGSLAQMTA
ncbi:MAG: glycogen synthase GlgA [Janthinobacterium lividum]